MDRKNVLLFLIGGLIVALGLAFFVSPFASTSPDGLNKVAIDKGFDSTQKQHSLGDSPLAGYEVRGVEDRSLSKGLSGDHRRGGHLRRRDDPVRPAPGGAGQT
jgi:hypothetical protein